MYTSAMAKSKSRRIDTVYIYDFIYKKIESLHCTKMVLSYGPFLLAA